MKLFLNGKALFYSVIVITLFAGSTVYSQKRTDGTSPDGSVKLEYRYSSENAIKYLNTSKIVQDMDINGQSMLVYVSTHLGCKVRLSGKQGTNLKLEIRIDTMAQSVDSPQGLSGGAVNDVRNKVFNMMINSSGKTTDISEAAKIVINVPGSGETDASQTFLDFFPALPAGPVRPGETWVTMDTINSKTKTATIWMPMESKCKFEGIEKINGIDCAKISASVTGSRDMTNQSQGMYISTKGTFTGTRMLFFAVKEGYFVKESFTTKMIGNIDIPDQSMSFPVVMDITSVNEIVK